MEAAWLMKKAILLSKLNLNSCLTYAAIRQLFWGNYELQVSFVPECNINTIANRATKIYDLVIGIDYSAFFIKNSLTVKKDHLVMLSRVCDQQNEDFIPILLDSGLENEALEISKIIGKIAKEKSSQGFYVDPYLTSRYLKTRLIINLFYGLAENVKFHTEFLLELIGEEESAWINELLKKYLKTIN